MTLVFLALQSIIAWGVVGYLVAFHGISPWFLLLPVLTIAAPTAKSASASHERRRLP